MKHRGTITRILAASGLLLVCVAAAASVVLRAWPRGNLAAAARRRASAAPALAAPLPVARTRGVLAPWHVGIQAGHWQIDQLPDEQYRLRGDTGAQWRTLTEAGVNMEIAGRVVRQLREAGVTADLLPATVPPGYDADAFVAIHADDGAGTSVSGWKVATPWRSSEASRRLRDDIARTYSEATGLPEDRYGVSYNMRGYYAFSWTRYEHAAAPTTPAVIIETGFLTSAVDRLVIVGDPERAARGISAGIIVFLGELAKLPDEALVPIAYPPMEVAGDNAALRYFPDPAERIRTRLAAGTRVRPVRQENGWTELIVWGNYRVFGWMKDSDLRSFTME
jgi:N-acetylmuramoyl-L-alanine amidase